MPRVAAVVALLAVFAAAPAPAADKIVFGTDWKAQAEHGGLALVGAVVAEFVAGTGGSETGLAFRILEAGYRLQIPRLFAALLLPSLSGVAIHAALHWLSNRLLRHWHASALTRLD